MSDDFVWAIYIVNTPLVEHMGKIISKSHYYFKVILKEFLHFIYELLSFSLFQN